MYRRGSVPQTGLLRTGIVERGRGMGTVGGGQRGKTLVKEKMTKAEIEAIKNPEVSVGEKIGRGILDTITAPLSFIGNIFGF